ncbi:MAG TPA: M15 family metallopeptidase [Polyangiaceae bacterium LLY-WYZ-15_(1-7)]|nr:M15 family metallopeptidase [Polyangiaceae bacterium LLY-WYZ-15_(1-7)]HJL11182.1 M15 family metallopeptidase [Polyangiaceae bacterium LLY-WYZ-15_(1-7)]HJL23916.1 M15 family metallopeptidase [Polyangiaceae bacterium LLY-WYZ-15_(1-7)]HJL39595.1 M15 family metallopeptidase [Polyangiaceae bacterium LLY-WYZ-15_(1-7)]HJL50668.1 M15 family metallopeptidase [Polyangiaceae bacterium LLY-WYZ-15_(1-7)]
MSRRNVLLLTMLSSVVALGALGATAAGQNRPQRAPIPDDAPPRPENETACNYQDPIPWLVRENFLPRWTQPPEEQRRRRELQQKVVRFRTERYGYFEDFGDPDWNEHPPRHYSTRIEWMGLPVRINERVVPALRCVEEQIRAECGGEYEPVRLSGLRTRNTYHNGQVSNHVYGIAIDVDPHLNTCCMCVAQWGDHPLCQNPVESIYERMAMPPCWVHVFERFGFYWLGRDRLQDTMHFEFLGDPDHILKTDGPAPHMAEAEGAEGDAEGEDAADEGEEEAAAEPAESDAEEASAGADVDEAASMEAVAAGETATEAASAPPATGGGCGCSAAGL